jgi:hypothetical protein
VRTSLAQACLRRHYPDQVQTVGGLVATLSASLGSRTRPMLLRRNDFPTAPEVLASR